MDENIFCRHINAGTERHRHANPLFDIFCHASISIAQSSSNDDDAISRAKTIYVDQLKIADPPWTAAVASQWKAFFGKSPTASLNVYFLHVNDPDGLCNRGTPFTSFIQQSHDWTESYDQPTALAAAAAAYKKMVLAERKVGDVLERPERYPTWNPHAWVDYFYKIACTEACRQQLRKKRRIEMEEASLAVFAEATKTLITQMQTGDTKDVMQVTSAYTGAAQVYQKLYLNKEDGILKKNT